MAHWCWTNWLRVSIPVHPKGAVWAVSSHSTLSAAWWWSVIPFFFNEDWEVAYPKSQITASHQRSVDRGEGVQYSLYLFIIYFSINTHCQIFSSLAAWFLVFLPKLGKWLWSPGLQFCPRLKYPNNYKKTKQKLSCNSLAGHWRCDCMSPSGWTVFNLISILVIKSLFCRYNTGRILCSLQFTLVYHQIMSGSKLKLHWSVLFLNVFDWYKIYTGSVAFIAK